MRMARDSYFVTVYRVGLVVVNKAFVVSCLLVFVGVVWPLLQQNACLANLRISLLYMSRIIGGARLFAIMLRVTAEVITKRA